MIVHDRADQADLDPLFPSIDAANFDLIIRSMTRSKAVVRAGSELGIEPRSTKLDCPLVLEHWSLHGQTATSERLVSFQEQSMFRTGINLAF
jgi:hypothetical protein